jgi:hypothetical protein
MLIPSDRIPQADVLEDVMATVEAVGSGARTFQDIATAIGKVERQGRYYRRAAENLGLIERSDTNHSVLTERGHAVLDSTGREPALRDAILTNILFRRLLEYIRGAGQAGISRTQIEHWLEDNTELSGTTPGRRVSTVVHWLETARLVTTAGDMVTVTPNPLPLSALAPEEVDPLAPLTRDAPSLTPFGGQAPKPARDIPAEAIQVLIDKAKLERLVARHEELVWKVAERARMADYECSRNAFIDLFAMGRTDSMIFEMKTNRQQNTIAQVRRAVAQLYEYQYVHDLNQSRLVIVLTERPEDKNEWLIHYLERSRGILLAWDEGGALGGTEATYEALPWL